MKYKKFVLGFAILFVFAIGSYFIDSSFYLASVSMYNNDEKVSVDVMDDVGKEAYKITPSKMQDFVEKNRVGYLNEDGTIILDK
ncbi:hypothetical protein GF354_04330 [Candidatus Peregrinibacteria bacterium]|nr:hypothetical protein [Candidatus Peregrinibacteria bacterium]